MPPLIADYLAYLGTRNISPHTLRLRGVYLRQFAEERTTPDLENPATLNDYVAAHRHLWSDSTMNVAVATIRGLYKWAHENGRISEDPSADLAYVRSRLPVGRIAADLDITRGLERATPRQRLAILLMAQGGLRRAEVAAFPATGVRNGYLHIFGKGSKWRDVPILPDVDAALAAAPPVNGWYFPGKSGGHVYDGTVADWSRYLVGMPPHALRRRFATTIYEATNDIRSVQDLLGHSSVVVTERYIGVGVERVRQAALTAAFAVPTVAA